MMKRLMTLGVFLSSICGQPSLFADAGSMALGMEEGFYTDFNVNVSVVSKKSESLSEAPGVVTVITADEIKKMGYDTINDVISTVPGVTVTESYWGSTSFSFRGLRENHYNNRTLLLLNGTPIRNVTVGQYVLEGIPVNSIDRIEIIRGPGSVIYGNGGFAGVIKVITKDKVNTTGVAAMGGSKKTSDVAIEHGRSMGGINYYVAGSVRNSDGYKATAKDESGLVRRSGQYDKDQTSYEDDYDNAFGSFSLGGLKMGSYHFTQVKDKMGITPSHITTGFTKMRMSGASASYEHKIGALEVKPGAYYEWTYYKTYMDHFPAAASPPINQLYSGRRFGADLDGRIDLTESISGLTGMSFERQDTNPYEFRDLSNGTQSVFSAFLIPYHTYDMSAFAQLEVAPVAPLKIVGGVRYNNNMEYGATAVPRVNAVFKAAENLTVKAQYGQAYRNPTFFEKYVNTKNVLYGDPDLKPEKINTVELASDWFTKQRSVRFTFFNESTSNLIDRVK
ncbi:MAG: TonB-dependent receptor, partial [Elusimicrobia bacterium]|nr:TonB-dependent receptor [Elusimicrobiota bacterium]